MNPRMKATSATEFVAAVSKPLKGERQRKPWTGLDLHLTRVRKAQTARTVNLADRKAGKILNNHSEVPLGSSRRNSFLTTW